MLGFAGDLGEGGGFLGGGATGVGAMQPVSMGVVLPCEADLNE